jgi:hypothetical protein
MRGFTSYNKKEVIDRINRISIEKSGETVITKYDGRVINTTPVSNRYEIFDIVKYLKDKIDLIEQNFTIYEYKLIIHAGRQYLQLISDKVKIGGLDFYKSFYILNSTDKSRRLSFNVGLYCDNNNFYVIGVKNVGLVKKHLTGVTQAAETATMGLNDETFDEQVEAMNNLVGHRIQLSKLRQVILGDKEDVPQINHRKFDAFKNMVRFAYNDGQIKLTKAQFDILMKESSKLTTIGTAEDFYLDAFFAFQLYLRIFNRQDSHIIKAETDRIFKMTTWAVRNSVLEALGI